MAKDTPNPPSTGGHSRLQPPTTGRSRRNKPLFYGWWIVGGGTLIQFVVAALWIQSYGVYVALIREEFDWSKATMAGIFSIAQITQGAVAPIQGWLIDLIGARMVLRLGLIMFGFGLIGLSRIESLIGSYVVFAVIFTGVGFGGFATVMTAIVVWFREHRSLALSISQAGFSFGGLFVPLIIYFVELFGWRATAFWSGVLVMVLGLAIAQVFKSKPDADSDESGRYSQSPGTAPNITQPDSTTMEALKSSAFWLISIGHGIALLVVSSVGVHMVTHLIESLNFSLAQTGYVITFLTVCQLVGQFSGGALGDRFDKRLLCALCMFGHGMGMLLLAFASNVWMIGAFAILHGVSWGIRGPLMVALRADYFGSTSFGKIMGISTLIVVMGLAIGPVFAGYLGDLFGTYQIAFVILALIVMTGALCFLMLAPQRQLQGLKAS